MSVHSSFVPRSGAPFSDEDFTFLGLEMNSISIAVIQPVLDILRHVTQCNFHGFPSSAFPKFKEAITYVMIETEHAHGQSSISNSH